MIYIGYLNQSILWISQTECVAKEPVKVLRAPQRYAQIDPKTLMSDYIVCQGSLVEKNKLWDRPTEQLKVAMISIYGVNCGIATYTKYVCDEMAPLVQELRIFAEDFEGRDVLADQRDNVIRCWNRKGDFTRLFNALDEYMPDIVYVQHEYGTFNNAVRWNALLSPLSKWRTVVVLHSVYAHPDKLIFESPCREIITHSVTGRELLKKKGVNHCAIHYIPHGCLPPQPNNLKFRLMGSNHVIFQYGFGFEYKGWETAIDIVDGLRKKYSDVCYMGIFNVAPNSAEFHDRYYDKLLTEVRKRDLTNHFILHKGFRSEPILLSYLQQAQVAIFPYWNHPEWMVHGGSGAVRMALASGTPTIVGSVPFFEEFKGHVPTCATLEDYLKTISKIFDDEKYAESVKSKIHDFIIRRTWANVAKWYLSCKPTGDFIAEP